MNEDELQRVFAQLRADSAPPLRLTPDAVLGAGRRIRRRRRAISVGVAVVAVVAMAPVLLGLREYAGDRSAPVPPAAPSHVVGPARPSPYPSPTRPSPSPSPGLPGSPLPLSPGAPPAPSASMGFTPQIGTLSGPPAGPSPSGAPRRG